MNESKKVLFLCEKMSFGGVEMSMLRLIKLLHKNNYDITLALMEPNGVLSDKIPEYVHTIVLDCYAGKTFCENKISNFLSLADKKFLNGKMHISSSRIKDMLKLAQPLDGEFDLAIDYHGYGSITLPYLVKKVKAKKKIGYIHDENISGYYDVYKYMKKLDAFFAVSKGCLKTFTDRYPELKPKVRLFENILDKDEIVSLSKDFEADEIKNDIFTMVSVGRLEQQKGFDRAVNASKKLKDEGFNFRWYIIGDGSQRDELENSIKENDLEETVFLLGAKQNPFPYIIKANMFVQVSRHEGKPLSVTEALSLNLPVLVTNYAAANEQIENGVNGFIVENSEEGVVEGLRKVLSDTDILNRINHSKLDFDAINNKSLKIIEEYV